MWRYVGNLGVLQGLGQEDWLGGRETGCGGQEPLSPEPESQLKES